MVISELRKQLEDTEKSLDRVFKKLYVNGGMWQKGKEEARKKLESEEIELEKKEPILRRQLAEASGEEHAIRLDLGIKIEAAVSGEMLVQTDNKCLILFNSSKITEEGTIPTVIVELEHTVKTQFGLPNDSARSGHPLYNLGMRHYAYDIFEVLNSSWLAQVEAQNQIDFPEYKLSYNHYIFQFHDSSFECLSKEMKISIVDRPFKEIWEDLFNKISSY
jgi:hypothetical protein